MKVIGKQPVHLAFPINNYENNYDELVDIFDKVEVITSYRKGSNITFLSIGNKKSDYNHKWVLIKDVLTLEFEYLTDRQFKKLYEEI